MVVREQDKVLSGAWVLELHAKSPPGKLTESLAAIEISSSEKCLCKG